MTCSKHQLTSFSQAVICLFVFSSIGIHTLLRVRSQVKLAERKNAALTQSQATFYLFSSRVDHPQPPLPIGTSSGNFSNNVQWSSKKESDYDGTRSNKFADDELQSQQVELPYELVNASQTETTSVMFPALKVKPGEKLTKVQAAARRYDALRLVYRNLIVSAHSSVAVLECSLTHISPSQIQYLAIGAGTASFGTNALFIACTSYHYARHNKMGIIHESSNLIAAYNVVLFGGAITGALLWRSFDPAFTLKADEVEEVECPLPPQPLNINLEQTQFHSPPSDMIDLSHDSLTFKEAHDVAPFASPTFPRALMLQPQLPLRTSSNPPEPSRFSW